MREKIAIIHPKLGWGGSEATVLWMIEALKEDYIVSLITSGAVDINKLNKFYGTVLKHEDFYVIQVPMPFIFKNTSKFAALRGRYIQRYCQKISSQFDLMINAYNPCDFKTKGIQFATDIEELPNILPLFGFKKWWYSNTPLRRMYLKLCDWISINNIEEWNKNLTLSNSYWTARLMKDRYNIDSDVLYPPVAGDFPNVSYEKREQSFVCIGRIVPEKNIHIVIDIINLVRQKGLNIDLHIIGGTGDKRYEKFLRKTYSGYKWLFFEGRLSEEDKKNIISKSQFGISCRKDEPFGIAVAEMVKAGCIVFVPNSGGQTEIVNSPNLIYNSIEDAMEKIEFVIKNRELQTELRNCLATNSLKFSVETFKEKIKKIVKDYLNNT